ncbi:luciferin 4-monooxygenase-like [Bicyclus anynana]|uniref:Luciferin 4-monooxygenase-like n=1 Tax=Bicyclus anynana TaxID=110368 RepID=A0A6J1N5L6_BICAN|nr:luciferin 4-monooxygenase-like [Bicyclus anynana]
MEMTYPSEAIFWYIQELTAGIIAESGIPSDRYHLGKIIHRSLKDAPDHILQIDGANGEKDTFKSALERSKQCAKAFRSLGLKYQDVIVIMAPNHINLVIPMYAALFNGIQVACVDMTLGVTELQDSFKCNTPKAVFCQSSNVETVREALKLLNNPAQIIVFDKNEQYESFHQFLEKYGQDTAENDFKPADFDPAITNAILMPTSGSTGTPKTAVLTHKNILVGFPHVLSVCTNFPTPFKITIVISPIQWVSAVFQFIMGPILRFTRVQTSSSLTAEHVRYLINKYKPEYTITSPTFLTTLIMPGREKCDFTSFQWLMVGGSNVTEKLIEDTKKLMPKTHVRICYGITEGSGMIFNFAYAPAGSVGFPTGHFQYKLTDPTTDEEILTHNLTGELRLKGPALFKCYYNNPVMTKATFDDDGWFKTGDLFYRDEHHNYYYVDRLKLLLKYRNHQVSPVEIESVIIKHPGVLDVAVTGIPDPECGDLPVALVILEDGHKVTAQEIKDLVKESLTDTKQLRGGVFFLKEFPTTSTSKLDRVKLKELAKILSIGQ